MPKKKKKKAAKKKAVKKKISKKKTSKKTKADQLLSLIPIEEIKKELSKDNPEEDYDREEIAKMFEAEDEADDTETATEGTDEYGDEGEY